jgi:hypothetical protein
MQPSKWAKSSVCSRSPAALSGRTLIKNLQIRSVAEDPLFTPRPVLTTPRLTALRRDPGNLPSFRHQRRQADRRHGDDARLQLHGESPQPPYTQTHPRSPACASTQARVPAKACTDRAAPHPTSAGARGAQGRAMSLAEVRSAIAAHDIVVRDGVLNEARPLPPLSHSSIGALTKPARCWPC